MRKAHHHLTLVFIHNRHRRKMLVSIGLPFAYKQWVSSAQENQKNTVPLTGYAKLFETAIHKTGASATYITSMKDSTDNSFYIASNTSGTSNSYWLGIFK